MTLDKATRKIAIEQAKKEALKQLMEIVHKGLALQMELVMALVLHDKFGFGKERCTKAINGFEELWDSMNQQYCTVEDVAEVVKKEIGIELDQEVLDVVMGRKDYTIKLDKEEEKK